MCWTRLLYLIFRKMGRKRFRREYAHGSWNIAQVMVDEELGSRDRIEGKSNLLV
jgi:hypothetical protein